MKKTFLCLVGALALLSASVDAKKVIVYEKEGGEFHFNFAHGFYVGYNDVDQDLIRTETNTHSGVTTEYWKVTCNGPGLTPCRFQGISINGGTFDTSVIDGILSEMVNEIDKGATDRNELTGTKTQKFRLTSLDGEYWLVGFTATWDLNENGDGKIIIVIDEVEFNQVF